jgi:hypothetical protein
MKDIVEWADIERDTDVMLDKSESGLAVQMSDVFAPPGEKTVNASNAVPLAEKCVAEMRSQKTCTTSNDNVHNPPRETETAHTNEEQQQLSHIRLLQRAQQ